MSRPPECPESCAAADAASRSGMVMMAMMILFGSITLLSIAAFMMSSTDVLVAGQYAQSKGALFNAEAGIQAVKTRIQNDLASGVLTLDSAVETVDYTPVGGYEFSPVTTLTRLANKNAYYFTVTGRTVNAQTVVEATFERINALDRLGIFGNSAVGAQPNVSMYSYSSSENPNPSPSDSSGEALMGSNGSVYFGNGGSLDGTLYLGEDDMGNPATASGADSFEVRDLGEEIESDPLGADGGELESALQYFRNPGNNNNADAVPRIVNNQHTSGSLHLPPGNYYLKDLNIGAGQTLSIGGTAENPVRIFFEGQRRSDGIIFMPNSEISFTGTVPSPPGFQLYVMSDHDIRVQPKLDFYGMIYAPDSDIEIHPGGNIYGAIWGDSVQMQPGVNMYVDMTLVDQFSSDAIQLISWKEVRNP